ncbi:MAG: type II secretion system F family protein [Acidobacteriota bacterium]
MPDLLGPEWLTALGVFAAVALAVVCVSLVWEGLRRLRRQRTVARRLEDLARVTGDPGTESDVSGSGSLFRSDEGEEEPAWLLAVTRFVPRREDLRRLLEQADSDWGVGTFLLATLGLGAGAGLSATVVMGGPAGPLLVAAGAAALPYLHLRRRRKKRSEAFEEHFPEAIELLARSLRAGHALLTGLEVVAEESPAPVDREFRQVYEEQRFGLPLEESLLGLGDRVDTVDVRMFVTSVMIQRDSGGNLAEILDNLAGLIRERFKFRRQLRVHTAQGRMTGYLLAVLPVAVGLALFTINRDYMVVLIEEPAGRLMLMGTAVMQIVGFLWIRKIVDIRF